MYREKIDTLQAAEERLLAQKTAAQNAAAERVRQAEKDGAALIAATEGISMAEGVGAFVIAGALVALTGAVKPLGRVVGAIPDGIAAGMLAGVLLPFCLRLPAATPPCPR